MQPDDCLVVWRITVTIRPLVTATIPAKWCSAGLSARDGRYAAWCAHHASDVGATVCEFFRAPPPQNGRLFFPPSGLQETPYEF